MWQSTRRAREPIPDFYSVPKVNKIRIDWTRKHLRDRFVHRMSKPALGRGLGTLLASGALSPKFNRPKTEENAKAGMPVDGPTHSGVSLLLQSTQAQTLPPLDARAPQISSVGSVESADLRLLPAGSPVSLLIPRLLWACDGLMILAASIWTVVGVDLWRWAGIGLLLAVGATQSVVGWLLLDPGVSGVPFDALANPSSSPSEARPPRVRVHFVDEIPRNRR